MVEKVFEEMARIRTEFLRRGMKLGEDIHGKDGGLLMQKGTELDDSLIKKLLSIDIYYPEIAGISEGEVDSIYEKNATEDQKKMLENIHKIQFSMCVELDPFVQELKKISRRSLFASLKS